MQSSVATLELPKTDLWELPSPTARIGRTWSFTCRRLPATRGDKRPAEMAVLVLQGLDSRRDSRRDLQSGDCSLIETVHVYAPCWKKKGHEEGRGVLSDAGGQDPDFSATAKRPPRSIRHLSFVTGRCQESKSRTNNNPWSTQTGFAGACSCKPSKQRGMFASHLVQRQKVRVQQVALSKDDDGRIPKEGEGREPTGAQKSRTWKVHKRTNSTGRAGVQTHRLRTWLAHS